MPRKALIIVDVQNDFCPGGALAVPAGDEVIAPLNRWAERFTTEGWPVFATRDWHPADHVSFRARGGPWPAHCVQGTPGASWHPDLRLPPGTVVISKGDHPDREAYSGFEGTDLERRLRELGVTQVYVGGLATDYCVKNTVLDAVRRGFATYFLTDACRGVNVQPGDADRAIAEMEAAGARPIAG